MKTRNFLISISIAVLLALLVSAEEHNCVAHYMGHTDQDAKMCVTHCNADAAVAAQRSKRAKTILYSPKSN